MNHWVAARNSRKGSQTSGSQDAAGEDVFLGVGGSQKDQGLVAGLGLRRGFGPVNGLQLRLELRHGLGLSGSYCCLIYPLKPFPASPLWRLALWRPEPPATRA